ncbi:hypothetical protein [Deinococcus ficus]|uniref:hypothetical protein n=1 Tax=Deinococcus ficus TaxID=317577 RepID=UPI0003B74601|nr:hypothetical protein [Deinococcus ficus]
MAPSVQITEPAVPTGRVPYLHPTAALVIAALLLRYSLPDLAEATATRSRSALSTGMDLMTMAVLLLALGLHLARSQAGRRVAERGPEAGVRRARRLFAWITPLFMLGMIYGFEDSLPLSAAVAYVTPILHAVASAYAYHLQQAAQTHT